MAGRYLTTNIVALDASSHGAVDGGPGLGAVSFRDQRWFKCCVPPAFKNWPICDLELLCHVVAFNMWGHLWKGEKIYGLTDSEPCELLLRHGRSRIPRRLEMARFVASAEHRLCFRWVSGPIRSEENILPDCASRWGDPERRSTFARTCEELNIRPTEDFVSPDMFLL